MHEWWPSEKKRVNDSRCLACAALIPGAVRSADTIRDSRAENSRAVSVLLLQQRATIEPVSRLPPEQTAYEVVAVPVSLPVGANQKKYFQAMANPFESSRASILARERLMLRAISAPPLLVFSCGETSSAVFRFTPWAA